MQRTVSLVGLCVVSFVAGGIATRLYDRGALVVGGGATAAPSTGAASVVAVDFTRQPLWAYGFLEAPSQVRRLNRRRRPLETCGPTKTPPSRPGLVNCQGVRAHSRSWTFATAAMSSTGIPAIIRPCPTSSSTAPPK